MKIIFFFSLIIATNFSALAQSHIGLTLGGSRFSGDVHGSSPRPEIGVFFKKNIANHFAIRTNLLYTTIIGDDSKASYSDKEISIRMRNLSFRSRVIELNVLFEYYIIKHSAKHSPYIFLGGGLFYFNPQAKYHDAWINLQPLGTEGQQGSSKYKKLSPAVIAGLGYRYSLTEKITIGIELGFRLTRTDYLDDVSGTYADKSLMKSQVARDLSDRSGDLIIDPTNNAVVYRQGIVIDPYTTNGNPYGSTPGYRINGYGSSGDIRGDAKMDKYFICNFTISYKLSN